MHSVDISAILPSEMGFRMISTGIKSPEGDDPMNTDADRLVELKKQRINDIHTAEPSRTALLVIDMQNAFTDPRASLHVPGVDPLIPVIADLIDFSRGRGIPVIYTAFVSDPLIPTLRKDPFGPEHLAADGPDTGWGMPSGSCIPGTDGPESPSIIDELKPRKDELVITAHSLDKFFGTPLDMVLRARDIRYLAVTGILADLCVLATVFGATAREYRVSVIKDGIMTLWPDIMTSVLDIMERKLARVISSSDLKKELSAHP
jgi:nicotinamidase-related amidase